MRTCLLLGLPRVQISAFAALLLVNLTACDWMHMKDPRKTGEARIATARMKRDQLACASGQTYERLKNLAFNQAIRIRNADPVNLDKLASFAVVRMEDPRVKDRDESLDITVCSGRFIFYVPPGAEHGFNGATRLEADVEYTAQQAADGSGLIYQLNGADSIIYRLAAFDLQGHVYDPPAKPEQKFADAAVAVPATPPGSPPVAQPGASPAAAAGAVASAAPPPSSPAPNLAAKAVPVAVATPPASPRPQPAVAPPPPPPPAKRPVQTAQAAGPNPGKPQFAKPVPRAIPPRPSSHGENAMAAAAQVPPAKHAERLANASALRRADRKARKTEPAPGAARTARAQAEQAMAAKASLRSAQHADRTARAEAKRIPEPRAAAKKIALAAARPASSRVPPPQRRVQTARAAAAKPVKPAARPEVQKARLAAVRRPPAVKAVVKQPAVLPRPAPSQRLAGLAAAIAAAEMPAKKATPAATATKPAAPATQSVKLASQSVAPAASQPKEPAVRMPAPPLLSPPSPLATNRPPARSPSASNDCSYTQSRTEDMVCGNARIASLDRSMRRMYSAALSEANGPARYELQRTRDRFMAYIDRCVTESCVARAYQGRMAEIRDIVEER